jgi:hypothetical protein
MKQKLFLMIGLGAMMLTSCSDNDDMPKMSNTDSESKAVTITAGIEGLAVSRAVDNQWQANDGIGVTSSGMMENVHYVTTAGDGTFRRNDLGKDYYKDESSHHFTAYYPYSSSVSNNQFTITTSSRATAEGQKGQDFLFAEADADVFNPNVKLNFSHQMARLIFNVKVSTEDGFSADDVFGTVDGSNIKLSYGRLNSALASSTVNITTGVVTPTKDASNIVMTSGTDDKTLHVRQFILIIPSQDICSYSHIFNQSQANEQVFTTELGEGTWDAGYSYTYNVTIKRDSLTITDATIEKWNDGGSSSTDARPGSN